MGCVRLRTPYCVSCVAILRENDLVGVDKRAIAVSNFAHNTDCVSSFPLFCIGLRRIEGRITQRVVTECGRLHTVVVTYILFFRREEIHRYCRVFGKLF